MRIGIDLQVLGQKHLTGVGKYALNISRALLELKTDYEFIFFVPSKRVIPDLIGDPVLDSRFRGNGKINIVVLPRKRIPFVTAHWAYARIMQKARLDVLFGPANTTPWFYPGRTVITIHDLAIYKHPEWFPRHQRFSTRFLVPRSVRKASRIIVPSLATARDLIELFTVSENKIAVIPHGVEQRFFRSSVIPAEASAQSGQSWIPDQVRDDKGQNKYLLFVGTLEPRKNVDRLIEAYALLPEDIRAKYELWIAGDKGMESEKLKVKSGKIGGRIRFLGYVPDEDLPALYQGAAVFVYPSLYEGFGMPVLEAMATGVPVVTSNISSLPEVIGEAGITINPRSRQELANAIVKYLSPPRAARGTLSSPGESNKVATLNSRDEAYSRQISSMATSRAREFTWDLAARRTLQVFSEALEGYKLHK